MQYYYFLLTSSYKFFQENRLNKMTSNAIVPAYILIPVRRNLHVTKHRGKSCLAVEGTFSSRWRWWCYFLNAPHKSKRHSAEVLICETFHNLAPPMNWTSTSSMLRAMHITFFFRHVYMRTRLLYSY